MVRHSRGPVGVRRESFTSCAASFRYSRNALAEGVQVFVARFTRTILRFVRSRLQPARLAVLAQSDCLASTGSVSSAVSFSSCARRSPAYREFLLERLRHSPA